MNVGTKFLLSALLAVGITVGGAMCVVAAEKAEKNVLVVYFSVPETSNPNNMTRDEDNSVVVIDGKVLGNTQYMAMVIAENMDADIFRIEPRNPYPTAHRPLLEFAQGEKQNNARPEIAEKIQNIEKYDVIFVGYPNWWADMPMILYTFLEEYDLSGKTIVPFNTHGGSGFSGTVNTIARLQPKATVRQDGLSISRDSIQNAGAQIIAWVNGLGIKK